MKRILCSCLIVTGIWGCAGGGGNGPALYPVKGTLMVDGKPVANVGVQLVPIEPTSNSKNAPATYGASGFTDAGGNFSLNSVDGKPGAVKGKYKVILTYSPKIDPKELSGMTKGGGPKGAPPPKVELPFPKQYSRVETSTKEFEVTETSKDLKLEF